MSNPVSNVSVTVKIDRNIKAQADALLNSFGLNFTTAINVFLRQMIKQNAIPFTIQELKTKDSNEMDLNLPDLSDDEW